jgi:hypothetical protein
VIKVYLVTFLGSYENVKEQRISSGLVSLLHKLEPK